MGSYRVGDVADTLDASWRDERRTKRCGGSQACFGVTDHIAVKPRVTPAGIQTKIEEAFKRSAEIDAHRITAEVLGSTVVLRGAVRSWAEKQEAERVAWASPGVSSVKNDLTIAV